MDGRKALKLILLTICLWSRTLVASDFSFLLDTESAPLIPIPQSSPTFSTETESREGIEQEIIYIHRPGQEKERISKKALRDFTQSEKFAWVQFYDSTTMMPTRAGSFEERFEQTLNLLPHDKYLSTVDISSISGMAAYEGFRRAVIDRENSGHCPTLIDPKPRTPVLPINQRDGAIKLGICPFLSTEDQARLLEEFKQTYQKTTDRFTLLDILVSSALAIGSVDTGQAEKKEVTEGENGWVSSLAEKDLCLGNSQSTVDTFHKDYIEGRATLQQIAKIGENFDASRASEAHYRETLAEAVTAGQASIQDLQHYDKQVLQIEEKRQAFEHLTRTGDDRPLRELRAPTEAEMAETEIIRSTAIATIRETNPDFVVAQNVIDADGRVENRDSTAEEYTSTGSGMTAGGQQDKKDYSGINDEEERVSQIATDILVEGQRRGVDITEERALDMAQRVERTKAKTVHYDDIFGRGVDQGTTEADYEQYARDSQSQLKDHYEARRIARRLNEPDIDVNSPEIKALQERLAILKKKINEGKEKTEASRRVAEKAIKERKVAEQERIAAREPSPQKRQERRRTIRRSEGQLAAGGGSQQRRRTQRASFTGTGPTGGGGSDQSGGGSSGRQGTISNQTGGQQQTNSSGASGTQVAQQSIGSNSPKVSSGSDYPGTSRPASTADQGKGKQSGRSLASASAEQSDTIEGAAQEQQEKQAANPPDNTISPELKRKLASLKYIDWKSLSSEQKEIYLNYFKGLFDFIDLIKIEFDYEKLKEKYVVTSGDKLFIEKSTFLEIKDPALFTAFILKVLTENPKFSSVYLKDGAKAQKLSFHHSGDQEIGFAVKEFQKGFEDLARSSNFDRCMIFKVYSTEATAQSARDDQVETKS